MTKSSNLIGLLLSLTLFACYLLLNTHSECAITNILFIKIIILFNIYIIKKIITLVT